MGLTPGKQLTSAQQQTLVHLLAYGGGDSSDEAIKMYFAYTDRGIEPPWNPTEDYQGYCDLMLAHKLMSGLQREMWLEGHFGGDYPLGCVLADFLYDALERPGTWEKMLPAFKDAYNLHVQICGHLDPGYKR